MNLTLGPGSVYALHAKPGMTLHAAAYVLQGRSTSAKHDRRRVDGVYVNRFHAGRLSSTDE
jgi:hypothetical protein